MNLSFHQLQPTTDNTIESSDHIQTRTVETSNLSNCLNDNPPQVSVTKTPPEGQKVLTSKPVFWIPDDLYLSALHFNKLFEVRGYKEVSQVVPAQENYIIQSSDMKEATIKAIAWKIQAQGGRCKIYSSQLEFTSLVGEETSITEVTLQIHDYALEYDDWAGRLDKENLTVRQASEIARVAIALLPRDHMLVELGILRERCKQSSWEWSKLVMELEEQFQREVTRRGVGGSGGELPIVELSVIDRILEIIGRGLSPSAEKDAIASLAQDVHRQPKHIEDLARLLRVEMELEESRDEHKQKIGSLLKVNDTELDIADFLPKDLAESLKMWAKWLSIRPEVAMSAILAVVSSLHEVGTELIMSRSYGFRVPPTLFLAFIAESGQKKSPIFKNLITQPLQSLVDEARAEYEAALSQYDIDLAAWIRDKQNNPKPTKPGHKIYWFNNATGEGIQAQASSRPDKALFYLVDELKGLFDSANQYRNGRGSDRQDILSYYETTGQKNLRASGLTVDVDKIHLSIYGGIQPAKLKEHTQDLRDDDGYWARFLFVNQPNTASRIEDDGIFEICSLVRAYYQVVGTKGKQTYTLSPEAFEIYQPVYAKLEELRTDDSTSPGMRAIYAKLEGQIGRLALNLHALELAEASLHGERNGERNDLEISASTMLKAIRLADFYLAEVTALHTDSNADRGELPALLTKLLSYATTKGSLTAREAVTKFNAIKSSPQALEHFKELEAMGYGSVEKQKKSWVFIPIVDTDFERNAKRNGLDLLSSLTCVVSRNVDRAKRNGERNGFLEEESLSSNTSGTERNERNDFSTPPPFLPDFETDQDIPKEDTPTITPLRSESQNHTGQADETITPSITPTIT